MDEHALREALRAEATEQRFDPTAVAHAVERGRARRRKQRTVLLAVVPVVALAAAGGATAVLGGPNDTPPTTASTGGPAGARPVQLLNWRQVGDVGVRMEALLSGTLIVADDGCLAATGPEGQPLAIAWPPGWTATRDEAGRAVLVDDDGQQRAIEGEQLGAGGGFLDRYNQLMAVDLDHPCTLGQPRIFYASGEMDPLPVP